MYLETAKDIVIFAMSLSLLGALALVIFKGESGASCDACESGDCDCIKEIDRLSNDLKTSRALNGEYRDTVKELRELLRPMPKFNPGDIVKLKSSLFLMTIGTAIWGDNAYNGKEQLAYSCTWYDGGELKTELIGEPLLESVGEPLGCSLSAKALLPFVGSIGGESLKPAKIKNAKKRVSGR